VPCPTRAVTRAPQQEQARKPPALAAKHTEQLSTADAVGAADRTTSGTERRARTTGVTIVAAAQNGTSGVLAFGKHSWRGAAGATPRTGDRGALFAALRTKR
jgi:hypothetical protein